MTTETQTVDLTTLAPSIGLLVNTQPGKFVAFASSELDVPLAWSDSAEKVLASIQSGKRRKAAKLGVTELVTVTPEQYQALVDARKNESVKTPKKMGRPSTRPSYDLLVATTRSLREMALAAGDGVISAIQVREMLEKINNL